MNEEKINQMNDRKKYNNQYIIDDIILNYKNEIKEEIEFIFQNSIRYNEFFRYSNNDYELINNEIKNQILREMIK